VVVEAIGLPGSGDRAILTRGSRKVHMSMADHRDGRQVRRIAVAVSLLSVFLTAAACGAEGDGERTAAFQQVTASDSVLTIDHFLIVGFKKNKQYSVDELPGGVDAWTGFWGLDPYSRRDYEIRFYSSHEDALKYGPSLAEEVAGENAEAFRKNPTWKEGAKDRWQNAFTGDMSASSLSGPSPKFGAYAIFGNVLMLCEGADSTQGLERCEALVGALTAGAME